MVIIVENSQYNWFVRIGNMDSFKKQAKNIFNVKNPSYHTAPDRRGFYAFPMKFIEPFMVSSVKDTQPDLANYNKKGIARRKGEEPPYPNLTSSAEEEWEAYAKFHRENPFKELPKHKFFLSDDKMIWSHLTDVIPRNEIDAMRGTWCLSTVGVWKRSIGRAFTKWFPGPMSTDSHKGIEGCWNISNGKRTRKNVDYDDFEVFIPAGAVK